MKHKPMPDLNYLRSVLDYDPITGIFKWKKSTAQAIKIGQIAGYARKCKSGNYVWLRVYPYQYAAHRLAYYYITGIDPEDLEIDHINRNGLDNRFSNLRLAQHIQNGKNKSKQKNNSTGQTGVYKVEKENGIYWRVIITYDKKRQHLGYYKNFIYACLIYRKAAKKYFGKFARF